MAILTTDKKKDGIIGNLEGKFGVSKGGIFIYKMTDSDSKLMLTFKHPLSEFDKIKETKPIIIHKKSDVFYTINALNLLIGQNSPVVLENPKDFKIDWSKYKNKVILKNGENLSLIPIERIF